jgi:hypothetical protein
MADQIVHRMLQFTEQPHKQYLQAAMAKTDIFTVFTEESGHISELTRLVSGTDMHPPVHHEGEGEQQA